MKKTKELTIEREKLVSDTGPCHPNHFLVTLDCARTRLIFLNC